MALSNREMRIAIGAYLTGVTVMTVLADRIIRENRKIIAGYKDLYKVNHEAVLKFIKVTDPDVFLPITAQLLTDYEFQAIVRKQ